LKQRDNDAREKFFRTDRRKCLHALLKRRASVSGVLIGAGKIGAIDHNSARAYSSAYCASLAIAERKLLQNLRSFAA
jgi:hypothetical protein